MNGQREQSPRNRQRRQAQPRRSSDRLLMETIKVHRTLLDLLQGKSGNIMGALRRLAELGLDLGRREEDKQIGEALTRGLGEIAQRLLELGVIEQLPRKVRITKVLGKNDSKFPVGTQRIGWEMELPKIGQSYCLYMDNGKVFRTGEVADLSPTHFRTTNSVYELEVLEESVAGALSPGGSSKEEDRPRIPRS
jgi:hypothetical protein